MQLLPLPFSAGRPLLLFVLVALRGLPSIFGTLEALRVQTCHSSAELEKTCHSRLSCLTFDVELRSSPWQCKRLIY